MRTNLWTVLAVIAITGMAVAAVAQEPCIPAGAPAGCNSNGVCAPGPCCRMVTEMVPVKKIVYSTKCVPVCELHPGSHCGHGGGCCDSGCGPTCKLHYKNVLIKKEIVVGHKCVTKCVVQ